MDKVSNDLKALRARVDRQALGRHYHKSPDRARYWAIAEMLDVLPHVHTAWAFKTRAHGIALLRLLRNGVWETVAKGGSHDAQIYDPSAYLLDHGWAGYAVKRLTTLDDLIISYEP